MSSKLLSTLSDLLSPRACTCCGCRLGVDERVLCTACNAHLPRTLFAERALDNEMARLFWKRLPVERAAALFFYQPHSPSGQMIYELKYHNRPNVGLALGRLAAQEMARSRFFEDIDVIIPLPLARGRERERGYNQSLLIAEGVSEATHLPICNDAVRRIRETRSQTRLSHEERADNIEGAFRLIRPERVACRHVLIVDDIVTSGATVVACGGAIATAGGVRISVLSLGYTKV